MGCAALTLQQNSHSDLNRQIQYCSDVGDLLNQIRLTPTKFTFGLKRMLESFQNGKQLLVEKRGVFEQDLIYQSRDGPKAWKEAVNYLNNATPIRQPLIRNDLLETLAKIEADLFTFKPQEQSQENPEDYLLRKIEQISGDTVVTGDFKKIVGIDYLLKDKDHVKNCLLSLVIDDGIRGRPNRKAIFNEELTNYGSQVRVCGNFVVTVVILADDFKLHKHSETDDNSEQKC